MLQNSFFAHPFPRYDLLRGLGEPQPDETVAYGFGVHFHSRPAQVECEPLWSVLRLKIHLWFPPGRTHWLVSQTVHTKSSRPRGAQVMGLYVELGTPELSSLGSVHPT